MDAKTSLIQPTFLFDDRKRFDAECEHDRLRSSLQSDVEIPPTADPWKQRPVDFTMKNFHPNRKKNKDLASITDFSPRGKQGENTRMDHPAIMRPFAVSYQSTGQRDTNDVDDDNDFQLDTRIKYEKVKRMLNTEQYRNPKLHDFRQVLPLVLVHYFKVFFRLKIVSKYQRTGSIRISYFIST